MSRSSDVRGSRLRAAKSKAVAEYGDFQTPSGLARMVCALLTKTGVQPAGLLEPTCGLGSFLYAALDEFQGIRKAVGAEINPCYVDQAKATLRQRGGDSRLRLAEADFFVTDWKDILDELPEPILVLGNLPWVTNAQLGALGSRNLPAKSNFQNHSGLDAITGKSNFDISEWMLIRLLEAMNGRRGVLAILCKSSVARKVLRHAWKNDIALSTSAVYRIDADLHFAAAVDAVLLVTYFEPAGCNLTARVYRDLEADRPEGILGYEDGMLLADIAAYERGRHLCCEGATNWRSGIKHDCSRVMELLREGRKYRNGLGELVELEDLYVYPMLKSSDLANGAPRSKNRCMIVPQRTVGEDTSAIQARAPKTWAYLTAHGDLLAKRSSSIYRNRPAFSIFGVGDYTFAPWKVGISGFYKRLAFGVVGPVHGKPVVFDDTSYFLPCQTKEQAECAAAVLNSPEACSFYNAFVFWDSKRPITADVLRRLDLRQLAMELGLEDRFTACFRTCEDRRSCVVQSPQRELWS